MTDKEEQLIKEAYRKGESMQSNTMIRITSEDLYWVFNIRGALYVGYENEFPCKNLLPPKISDVFDFESGVAKFTIQKLPTPTEQPDNTNLKIVN